MKSARLRLLISVLTFGLLVSGCATSSPIQRYSQSESAFNSPPELITEEYPDKDVYRIFHRASTGFTSIQSLRQAVEQRAEDFAKRQGKSIIVLGESISEPPYILGNFPRIEIVFALIDSTKNQALESKSHRYEDLEKLKELLDNGVLTREEFDSEKAKILNE